MTNPAHMPHTSINISRKPQTAGVGAPADECADDDRQLQLHTLVAARFDVDFAVTLRRAARALYELACRSGTSSVAELAAGCGMRPSVARPLLRTLESSGWLIIYPDRAPRSGAAGIALLQRVLNGIRTLP